MEDFYIQINDNLPQIQLQSIDKNESLIKASAEHVDKIINVVQVITEKVGTKLKTEDKTKPSSISLEFGINLLAEAGFPMITKGSIGANFKICITWTNGNK